MEYSSHSRTGQSLLEILVGLGVGALLIIGAASIIAPSLQTTKQSGNAQNEAQLASELLSNVKVWAAGNWNNVLSLATGSTNTYYLNTVNSPFVVVGSGGINQETITVGGITYNRSFYLSDVYRDSNGNVTTTMSGNFYDPSSKQATAVVQMASSSNAPAILTLYITRTGSNGGGGDVFNQTGWGGGSGQNSAVKLAGTTYASSNDVAVSGGSLQLALTTAITNGENASSELGEYDNSGNALFTKGSGGSLGANNGANSQGFNRTDGVALDSINHRLFVADNLNSRVLVFPLDNNNNITTTTPSYVLGQVDFTSNVETTTQNGMAGPWGLAYDSVSSRLFVADVSNERVLVFPVAPGSIANGENASYVLGQASFTTSVGTTTQSGFNGPVGLAYDSASSRLFVGDAFNNRVLVFSVATSSIANGENASYVLGQASFTTSVGTTTQSGLGASVPSTEGLAYDSASSRLFVGDSANGRVLVFSVATSTITSGENASYVLGEPSFTSQSDLFAVTQAGALDGQGLAYDSVANRLFATSGPRVLVFSAATSTIANNESSTDVIGQANFTSSVGTTTQSGFGTPLDMSGLAYDPTSGNLFVADVNNSRVLAFAAATSTIATSGENATGILGEYDNSLNALYTKGGANNGPNPQGFYTTQGTALDSVNHRLFVTDFSNSRILVFSLDSNNNITTTTPSYVLGQANFTSGGYGTTQNTLNGPEGLSYDPTTGNLFVADTYNNRVLVFSAATSTIANNENASYVLGQSSFTGGNAATTQKGLSVPQGLTYDPVSGRLYVADSANNRVLIFPASSSLASNESSTYVLGQANFTSKVLATTQKGLSSPQAVTYDPVSSNLFVVDVNNNRVLVFPVGSGLANNESSTYVLGQTNFTSKVAAHTQTNLSSPQAATYDSVSGNLFVADGANNRVLIFPASSTSLATDENASYVLGQSSFTGNVAATTQSGMNLPLALSYDSTSGNLFIADGNNNRVLQFSTLGTTSYLSPGTLDSATFDTGVASGTQLNSVIWQGSANGITNPVGFQFAVSNASSGPWNFIGPDGTINTNYIGAAGATIPLSSTSNGYTALNGYRYFRYRIHLYAGTSNATTPTVTQVIVNWSP